MIGVAAPVFDIDGALALASVQTSDFDTMTRRVSRTATLDGGALFTDNGYSDADITLTITAQGLSNTDAVNMRRLVAAYTTLVVTTPRGAYLTVPQDFSFRNGNATLVALVQSKLSG